MRSFSASLDVIAAKYPTASKLEWTFKVTFRQGKMKSIPRSSATAWLMIIVQPSLSLNSISTLGIACSKSLEPSATVAKTNVSSCSVGLRLDELGQFETSYCGGHRFGLAPSLASRPEYSNRCRAVETVNSNW